jgi:hypothetical protein
VSRLQPAANQHVAARFDYRLQAPIKRHFS